MDPMTDADPHLDTLLQAPLLDVPEDFAARVMAALPAEQQPSPPPWKRLRSAGGWPAAQLLLTAACGALGAVQVLLFVGGVWSATVLGAR